MNRVDERNVGLDLAKLVSCILVVLMHTFRNSIIYEGIHGVVLIFITRCSMPLFFMAVGYIQLNRVGGGTRYSIKKIKNILVVGFGWSAILAVVKLVTTHDYIESAKMFLGWPLGRGGILQFWFLGSMMMIYALLSVLKRIYEKSPIILTTIFVTICVGIDIFNVVRICDGASEFVQIHVPLPFRMWSWIMYVLVGATIKRFEKRFSVRKLTVSTILLTVSAIAWSWYWCYYKTGVIDSDYIYDSLICILWSASLLLLFLRINYKNAAVKKEILTLSSLTMAPYALHFQAIQLLAPLRNQLPAMGQFLLGLTIFAVFMIAGAVIKRIPYMKRIMRL